MTGPDRSIYITSKKMPDQHTILKLLPHFLLPCSGHHTTSFSSSSFSSCKVEIGKEVELDVDLYSLWGEVSAVFHNFQLCGKIQGNLVMAFDPFAAVHPRKLIELLLDAEPERERILDHFSAQNSFSLTNHHPLELIYNLSSPSPQYLWFHLFFGEKVQFVRNFKSETQKTSYFSFSATKARYII